MALKVGELFASFGIDSSSVDSAFSQISQQCDNIGSKMMSMGAALSVAVTAPVTKFAKDMYEAGTAFESQMSKVQAIAGLDSSIAADSAAIQALTDKAIEMGSTTEWTSTQAGEALEYMAMAGWKADSMLAGLPSVMNLATAAGADLGTTSDIVTDAMTAFGLTMQSAGNDTDVFTGYVEHFADVLAAASTNSNTNVEMLGESFKYVAPLAGTLGMSVDEVAVALGLMANSGIKSTMSGAALRNILNGLMGTTKSTAEACETLGVSLYDEHGQTKSLMQVMAELRYSYKNNQAEVLAMQKVCADLDAQLASGEITQKQYEKALDDATRGSSDFMSACVQLAGKQGLSGLLAIMTASFDDYNKLYKSIEGCEGATNDMADTMRNNAQGAMTIFKSSVEGLQITLWTLASESFTNIVKKATEIVQSFQAMDSATQLTIMKFAGVAAAAGPVLIAGGKLVKMLPSMAKGVAALASPMGIVTAGLALFAVAAIDADNTLGDLFVDGSKNVKERLQKLNKTITSSMKGVSSRMGALCQSIAEGLHNMIPEAMDTITLVIEGFMDAIGDNAQDIADIGETIITDLLGGISSALPRLIPAAANVITNIATALINNIPSIVSAIGDVMGAFVEGIENTDWVGLAEKILGAIQGSVSELTNIFDSWFDEATAHTSDLDWASIGTQIIDLILDATTNTASAVGTFLTNLIDGIAGYTGWSSIGQQLGTVAEHLINGIADAIPGLTDVVVNIINSIGSALSGEGADSLLTGFQSLAQSIVNGLSNAIPNIADGATKIATAIADMLNGIDWSTAADVVSTLGQSIIDMIVTGIQSAATAATGIVEAIASLFEDDGLASKLATAAGTIAQTLITAIANAIPTISDAAVSIINSIATLLSGDNTDGFATAVGGMATTIINSLVDAIPKVASGAINLITAIGNLLTGEAATNLVTGFGTIATSIITGIVEAIPKVANAAVDIIGAIGQVLGGDKTDGVMESLTGVATSIINGIVDAIPTVADAAVGIINAIGNLFSAEGAGTTIATGALNIAKAIVDAVVDGIPKITDAAVNIINAIGGLFSEGGAASDFTEGATSIATSLINSIVEAIPALTDLAKGIVTAIGNALSSVDWSGAITDLSALGGAIVDAIVAGIKGIGEVGVSIVEAIGNMLGDIDWGSVTISLDGFADMLINGIKSGIEAMTEADVGIIEALGNMLSTINWDSMGDVTSGLATTLIQGIATGIGSLATGATQIVSALATMFSQIDWSKVGDAVSGIAQSLFDGICESASTLVPDMTGLITAIGNGISNAASGLGTLAGTLIGNLVSFLVSPENWQKLIEIGGTIIKGIAIGIVNLGGSILQGAWGAISGIFTGIFDTLGISMSSEATEAFNGLVDVINIEGDQVCMTVGQVFNNLQALGTDAPFSNIFDEASLNSYLSAYNACLATGQADIIAGIEEYSFLGQDATVKLFQLLVDTSASEAERASALIALNDLGLGKYISDEFGKANEGVVSAAANMSDNAATAFETAFTSIGYIIPDAVKTGLENGTITVEEAAAQVVAAASTANDRATAEAEASTTGSAVPEEMSKAEEAGESDVSTATGGLVDAATLAMETLPDVAKNTTTEAVNGMADGITNNSATVETAMSTLADETVNAALQKMTYDTGYKTGYDYADAMKQGIEAVQGSIKSSMETLANDVDNAAKNKLTQSAGNTVGDTYASAIKSAIEAQNGATTTAAQSLANAANNAVSNTLTRSAGQTIGSNFSSGIAAGINAGRSAIINAAASVAAAAVNKAKSALSIHSPSRVARDEIGLMYDAGLVEGLQKGMTAVENAAANVSASLHDSFYVGDTSRGTVYTSRQQAAANAQQNAEANRSESLIERAEAIGRAIADRLINSGALDSDIYMDEDKVGRKVARPVSATISRKTKETISGRTLQGVIA